MGWGGMAGDTKSSREVRPRTNVRYLSALLVFLLGACALAVAWATLQPSSAPGWLRAQLELIFPDLATAPEGAPIVIAVAADDPEAGRGQSIARGASLAIRDQNAAGGIAGRPLQLRFFDDGNAAEQAVVAAGNAVESDAVAVIGHRTSRTSAAAGAVYQSAGLPAITPTATSPSVTAGRDHYFSTIANDERNATFLAYYEKAVVHPDKIYILVDDEVYGQALTRIFLRAAERVGLPEATIVRLPDDPRQREEVGRTFLERLQEDHGGETPAAQTSGSPGQRIAQASASQPSETVALLLFAYPDKTIPIIRGIRDARLSRIFMTAPDAYDSSDFIHAFDSLPNEQRSPGFYTDGIGIATPFVFDTGGRAAGLFRQSYLEAYGSQPDWRAAFSYDAASALIAALRDLAASQPGALDGDPKALRAAVRAGLAAMDSQKNGIEGITGPIYFDADGVTATVFGIGRLEAKQLVSALSQYRSLQSLGPGVDVERAKDEGLLIDLGGHLMERAEVVFTGMTFDSLHAIDTGEMTAEIGGALWFRYDPPPSEPLEGPLAPENIVFLNAIGPVSMAPDYSEASPEGVVYRRFTFEGRFRMDFVPSLRRYGHPTVGLAFMHAELPSNRLVYVVDVNGMGLSDRRSFAEQFAPAESDLLAQGWNLERANAYQESNWVGTKGLPGLVNQPDGLVPHSALFAAAQLVESDDLLHGLFTETHAVTYFLIAGMIFLTTVLWRAFLPRLPAAMLPILLQFLAAVALLALGQVIVDEMLGQRLAFSELAAIDTIFATLWWLMPAYFLVTFVEYAIWDGILAPTGKAVPGLLRLLCRVLIYLVAIYGVLGFVFNLDVASLLATTGLIGLIIGLAVQGNLANIFSGLVLSAERPFNVGDVVEIAGKEIAGQKKLRVLDMTWRSVRLGHGTSREVSIPNADIAGSIVLNHTRSKPASGREEFSLPVDIPREKVVAVLKQALEENPRVLKTYPFGAAFIGLRLEQTQWRAVYKIVWRSEEPEQDFLVLDPVWNRLWDELGVEVVQAVGHRGRAAQKDEPQSDPPGSEGPATA